LGSLYIFVVYHNPSVLHGYIYWSILVVSQDIIVVAKTFEILSGKSKEEAMSDYITKVKQLQEEAATS
jgi:diazepam-binding inhibitor (GABA receptor modulating acyl-CoA-binding protein)